MQKFLTILLISCFLFGNWQCTDPFNYSLSSKIEMSKTPCFGACPEYSFVIDGKGNATYEGKKYVKLEGVHELNFHPETVNELFKAFEESNFWDFEDEYTDNIADLPTTYITFTHDGKSKKIKDYYNAPEKLKGLETGADDYLVKPFDTKELEVRVRNLIKIRTKLRERFSESDDLKSVPKGINSTDKAFFEKVYKIADENIANEQFSVEVFAKEVGMSRVHLNRKLKALTDLSANKFIQSYRLQKALELLRNKSGNVSEIAFETGFGSTAYFVKCFREKFGKTPGTILEE